jgi:carbon monoxide dehydrogenase subunit G
MKKLFGTLAVALIVTATAGAAGVWTAGSHLAPEQTVVMVVETRQGPAAVWRIITDLEGQATWHPGLASVRAVEDAEGRAAFEETGADGQVFVLVTTNSDPPRELTRELVGGGWVTGSRSLRVDPDGLGTRVTLTARTQISNPVARWAAVSVQGLDEAPHEYLRALADHLGDPQNRVGRLDGSSESHRDATAAR